MTVFYVFVNTGDSGVENVGETVLADVLLRKHPVDLRELVLLIHPQRPQVGYATYVFLEVF